MYINEMYALDTLQIYEKHVVTKKDLEKTELKLQAEIEKAKADTIKWVAGLLLAQAGLIAALVKLL